MIRTKTRMRMVAEYSMRVITVEDVQRGRK